MAYYPGTKYIVCTKGDGDDVGEYTKERGVFHEQSAADTFAIELAENGEACQMFECRWVELHDPIQWYMARIK